MATGESKPPSKVTQRTASLVAACDAFEKALDVYLDAHSQSGSEVNQQALDELRLLRLDVRLARLRAQDSEASTHLAIIRRKAGERHRELWNVDVTPP